MREIHLNYERLKDFFKKLSTKNTYWVNVLCKGLYSMEKILKFSPRMVLSKIGFGGEKLKKIKFESSTQSPTTLVQDRVWKLKKAQCSYEGLITN